MATPKVYSRQLLHEVDDHVRGYLAETLPNWGNGSGLVLTNLDIVHRVYGPEYDTDSVGRVVLLELKRGTSGMTDGQYNTFHLVDRMMSAGNVDGNRYGGCWLVNYEMEDDDTPYFLCAERVFLPAWRDRCRIDGHDAVMEFLRTGIGPTLTPEVEPW